MDKKKLMEHILGLLEKDWKVAKDVALATYEAATNEESKPENEYDTRALENSYLAGAQAKRLLEIEENMAFFKNAELKNYSSQDPIGPTALIEVDLEGKRSFLFLMPKAGGLNLTFEGRKIQVITPTSPLGEALVGLRAGGIAVVEMGPQVREYEIVSVE